MGRIFIWSYLICLSLNLQASTHSGRVVTEDGRPITAAIVKIKGSSQHFYSNDNGYFSIPRTPENGIITAWRSGFYIGTMGQKSNVIVLKPLPVDNIDYQFIHPIKHPDKGKRCVSCHKKTVEVWEKHGHSQGEKNQVFLALKNEFKKDYPNSQGSCNSCHAPINASSVTCDICHKINKFNKNSPGHGIQRYELMRPTDGMQLVIGPLKDVSRGHDTFSEVFRTSEHCAGCHSAKHHGKDTYDTYTQWLKSPAKKDGKICQDCHMPHPEKDRFIANGSSAILRQAKSIRNHSDPTMLKKTRMKFINFMLEATRLDQFLDVKVIVSNKNLAHSFPSRSPFRNAYVSVSARYFDHSKVPQTSGPTLPFDNASGLFLAKVLKPRFLIESYKKGASRKTNPWGEFFWWPFTLKQDSRIPPGKSKVERFSFKLVRPDPVVIKAELVYQKYFKEMEKKYRLPSSAVTLDSIEIVR
ncbi:MAG: hypothetical protein HRU09_12375 [Oligoflexales bacterium]|nr:hypothetical protein [Oligoflexales bacterium]